MILGETILWRPKNGFPQTPIQESRLWEEGSLRIHIHKEPFSEGDRGNRSLGIKERFPQNNFLVLFRENLK